VLGVFGYVRGKMWIAIERGERELAWNIDLWFHVHSVYGGCGCSCSGSITDSSALCCVITQA
jgi:hypothetical protein